MEDLALLYIAAISSTLTVIGAICIPLVLHRRSKVSETMKELDSFERDVSEMCKAIRDRLQGKTATYSTVIKDPELEALVFALLNRHEYLCGGVNQNIFDRKIVMLLRGAALQQTWDEYREYIEEYRNGLDKEEAWVEIDKALGLCQKSGTHCTTTRC